MIGNVPGARDPSKPDPFPFKPHASSLDTTTHSTLPTGMQTSIAAAAPITKTVPPPTLTQESTFQINAVETRRSKMKRVHPLQMPALQHLSVTPEEFCSVQESCPTLAGLWDKTKSEEMDQTKNGSSFQYLKIDDLLYRKCVLSTHVEKVGKLALVVPKECRPIILSVGHKNPLAGHFSQRKTAMKIADKFFWTGMAVDIRDFCRSCDICQRMSSKGRVKPVPLHPLPIITEPFSRVAMDLVGPLFPPSAEGHRYILTLIDFATGFPKAVQLKEVDSISVAEALLTIFSRVGIPREILSDQGTQFTSQLMAELHKLLCVKPSFTTPFHPSGNGRVERLHGPLKAALRKIYVIELQDKLAESAKIAAQNADVSTARYKAYFDVRSQDRKFQPGDEVLILLPSDKSKLLVARKGPYEVLEKRVAFAELLDEPSTIDDSPLHKEICLSEPEDSRLPVTPDGQTDETDSRPNVNPNLEGYQQTSLEELVYPVPVHLKPHFESEVERLFQQGIIQRSSSPHCSPVVMVRKSDGSYRMAIDYRQLNAVTVFHAESLCNIEEDLYKFSGSKYFSELDLCKAYYQIGLNTVGHLGLFWTGSEAITSHDFKVSFWIPNHPAADYTGPLSNLLRKTVREPLPWTEELQSLFNHLKLVLSSNPVLRLPDTSLTFVLRTDASIHGLGAVLLQYHLDYPHPVAFASRKLLDRESRYSTIERESMDKFDTTSRSSMVRSAASIVNPLPSGQVAVTVSIGAQILPN
ncbi:uncharacterized protein LOC143035033 [Oratosquilla oratoria]|uniref:uncharacterized protein LOC143035033 n=1 Tax=Oratosquilla oratoria TaxID=337810 RepID=UPI003F76F750